MSTEMEVMDSLEGGLSHRNKLQRLLQSHWSVPTWVPVSDDHDDDNEDHDDDDVDDVDDHNDDDDENND